LYGTDALHSTDALHRPDGLGGGASAIGGSNGPYDPARGAQVVAAARVFLDEIAPLRSGSHAAATGYAVSDGQLVVTLVAGEQTTLADPAQLRGYTSGSVLLVHHGLHVEIVVDRDGTIGADDLAGVQDVVVEAALTAIVDFEDSVAAVDADDKVAAYRNWLGLNRGDLVETVSKAGSSFVRSLAP
nr:hypothetical protein [Micromonospora sp. DSM 115978]